jgi:hypothetical protein
MQCCARTVPEPAPALVGEHQIRSGSKVVQRRDVCEGRKELRFYLCLCTANADIGSVVAEQRYRTLFYNSSVRLSS